MRNIYKISVGNPERNRSVGRHRRIWEDNIRIDLREIVWETVDWIHLAQDRGQWQTCEQGNEPSGPIKCGEFLDQKSDY